MAHQKLEFLMPAPSKVVFDAFHYHQWRVHWDSLVSRTQVQDGAPCPSIGVVSENTGGGLLRTLSMATRFVSYEPPRLAAAVMVGKSFPFSSWAASMRHVDLEEGGSMLVYTYTFAAYPKLLEPLVSSVFRQATHKRFARLAGFLAEHSDDVLAWQKNRGS